ncbi:MAG: hypothetical protein HRU41_24855 [Saprospiraceae bacterium]|nr:hypothetical protein [Saprospiraceae bacterium]
MKSNRIPHILILSALVLPLFLSLPQFILAQDQTQNFFEEIILAVDTNRFTWSKDKLSWQGEPQLPFEYTVEQPIVELRLYPSGIFPIDSIFLLPSEDFTLVDSLRWVTQSNFRAKVRFNGITNRNFLAFNFKIFSKYLPEPMIYELKLLPYTQTQVQFLELPAALYVGEEQTLSIETNHLNNLIFPKTWTQNKEINHRVFRDNNRVRARVQATDVGLQSLQIDWKVKKPYRRADGKLSYQLPPLQHDFVVKPAKLRFLRSNQREVTLTEDAKREGLEIELDFAEDLQMEKTYRLESQEEAGGYLMAEIFTRRVLANGKVLCWLRIYDYHRQNEGYLYIKDGDLAQFITNFDITPSTKVNKVSILREGQDWKTSRDIYPGEKISVRLEGTALYKADFQFEGLTEVQLDSSVNRENAREYDLSIPIDIKDRYINILNHQKPIGQRLRIREYKRPRPFDFIQFRYGEESYEVEAIDKLIFSSTSMDDIIIDFDYARLDHTEFHGPQQLNITVEIRDRRNQLVEQKTIPRIKACPSDASPRHAFYSPQNCYNGSVSINRYLRKKIYDLDPWSTIRITLEHDEQFFGKRGLRRNVEFVLFRSTTFDIDVSFPAGLITKRIGEQGFSNLGGISMAMIAQFSFYHENKVAKAKPYKFGAGFLAFNAFNFSENSSRDMGLVGLASLYPIRTKYSSRLSFPLFIGGGYFLSEQQWFVLLGPGIRVRL